MLGDMFTCSQTLSQCTPLPPDVRKWQSVALLTILHDSFKLYRLERIIRPPRNGRFFHRSFGSRIKTSENKTERTTPVSTAAAAAIVVTAPVTLPRDHHPSKRQSKEGKPLQTQVLMVRIATSQRKTAAATTASMSGGLTTIAKTSLMSLFPMRIGARIA